ncbi:AraC family transcriptional regulator, partial [Kitasatospora sp. NPDC093558]
MAPEYSERASRLRGAVVWTRAAVLPVPSAAPVLPDGCMDLLCCPGRAGVVGASS